MSCKICFNQYDHSIHKPYMLSCPHSFCISCLNKLTANKCPECKAIITMINPNIGILELIPESLYDQLKATAKKNCIEVIELNDDLKSKRESQLEATLNKINSTRNRIRNETNQFIRLVRRSEENLFNELNKLESMEKTKYSDNDQKILDKSIKNMKKSIESDSLNLDELKEFISIAKSACETLHIHLSDAPEFNIQNIEFNPFKSVSLEDGLIGEIKTQKKV